MIGGQIPVPVKKEDDEYIVPVKTRGENKLEADVTRAIYDLNCTMKEVLCELKLMNERLEESLESGIAPEDLC